MRWASSGVSPSKARLGGAWQAMARRDDARRGLARVTDGGTEGFGLPCHPHKGGHGAVEHGAARPGAARLGMAWRGRARRGKGCRQQHGASLEVSCCSLWRADLAWRCVAGQGRVWRGEAWRGMARQGLTISARRAQVLPAGFTQHTSWHDQQKRHRSTTAPGFAQA